MATAKSWKCEVCGYIHRGENPPETCPVCGVGADQFTLFEAVAEKPQSDQKTWRCTICGYVHSGEPPDLCPVCAAPKEHFEPVEAKPQTPGQSGQRIVIVGAGIAGLSAAEEARITAPNAKITLLSKEQELPYYRLNLSRFLAQEIPQESLYIHTRQWFDQNRIDLAVGEVAQLERDDRRVTLRSGEHYEYDRLVLTNGSHAFVPPIPGVTREGCHTLRTLADSVTITERASSGAKCVCIGGGALGLETAGALAKKGVDVTVLEGAPWLLPRQLSQPAGTLLQKYIERLGIRVLCGVKIKELTGDEAVEAVVLEDQDAIAARVVVLATGVRPNSYLARQGGLKVKSGIIVDDNMATSDPNIFAAGDVAEHRGVLYGLWPASYAQGVVAGKNAAGGSADFLGIPPSTRLKVLDVDMFSIGQTQPQDASFQVVDHLQEETYRRLVSRDGRLVGAILYGDTSMASPITEAIESGSQILESPELRALL